MQVRKKRAELREIISLHSEPVLLRGFEEAMVTAGQLTEVRR
jgi:hypothetical protein